MTPETSCYNATLFRFPLRQSDSESRITKTCYSPQKVRENLFSSLKVEAPKLLLFLKNVLKVSFYEWDELSKIPICKFCVSISETMKQYRKECYKLAKEYDARSESTTALLSAATTECFEEELDEQESRNMQYHWLIINSVGSDTTELRMLAEKMKVLPWVGVACPVAVEFDLQGQTPINLGHVSKRNELIEAFATVKQLLSRECLIVKGVNSENSMNGQAFCFLPLPGATALPVNLHGYFAVADNRRSIKWPSHDEKGEEAKWNKLLLDKVIAPLYALLLACRSCLLSYSEVSSDACQVDAYAAWPVYAEIKNQVIWREILQPVLTLITDLPILWTEAEGGKWISLKEAYFQNPDNLPPKIALTVLIRAGCRVIVLPSEIFATLQTNDEIMEIITSRYVTPELVRHYIRGKRNDLSQKEVYELLDYVLSSSPTSTFTSHELYDIDLIPLNSHETCSFSPFDGTNAIFTFTEKYKHALHFLPGISSIVLDTDIPFKLQDKLEAIAVHKAYQLRITTINDICNLLLKSFQSWSDFGNQDLCVWKPGISGHPTLEWINKLWSWIISNEVPLSQLKHVPIIPQEPICRNTKQVSLFSLSYIPGLCILPDRLPSQCSRDIMLMVIKVLGFISVHKSDIVFQAQGIKEYIKTCDARFIVKQLIKTNSTISFSQRLSNVEKDALSHLIAHDFSQGVNPNECARIKSLQIFKAGVGASPGKYVRLDSSNYILPPLGITFECDVQYPPEILNYGPHYNHQLCSFLHTLQTRSFKTIDDFCSKIIFPFVLESYEGYSDEMFKLVMWMLKLPLTNLQFLQGRKFIETSAHPRKLKAPTELYDPEDKMITLFYDSTSDDVFPSDKYSAVLPILRYAGMRTWDSLKSIQRDMISFLVDRAKFVSTLHKEEGLKRSNILLLHLLDVEFLKNSQLSSIKFLFLEETPPVDYPPQLSWYGTQHSDEKVSAQSVCFQASDSYIVGSILPILSSEYDQVLQRNIINDTSFHKIAVEEVIYQFSALSQVVSSKKAFDRRDTANITKAVFLMYDFLISRECNASTLPKKWIWWKNDNTFLAPEDCIIEVPLHFSLEPFVFSLSSDYELCRKVFAILPKHEFQRTLSTSKAVQILHSMSRESLSAHNLNIAISILQWLKEQHYKPQGDILIPTHQSTLVGTSECTYDDRNWPRDKADIQKLSKCLYVHENLPSVLAKYFCITPLSSRIAPSQKIRLKYSKAGQHEPITRRIKGIVEEYATSSDIFKELLQNADDANATEVKFLIDWRNHSANTLMTEELQAWQGPALIAYNNSVFSDEDFEHICELAAETKLKDPFKTGRFGIGFCATYQITDVPCFISRRYFTMFDPHTTHLRDRVSRDEPGMRIDLIENRDDLLVYEDQFLPYNHIFGCNIFQLPDDGYHGTLFRFPFRSTKTAKKSKICNTIVGRKQIHSIVTSFKNEAPHLLLFLKHVTKVSLSILEEGAKSPKEMVTIVDVEKSCECTEYGRQDLIKRYNSEGTRNVESHCTITTHIDTSTGARVSNINWLISSAIDAKLLNTKLKERGLVPFAEVAIQVEKNQSHLIPKPLKGYAFCFLPLPIKTGLPFHVNGFFDVNHDRSDIRSTDDERFGRDWNESLCRGALTQAFIAGMSSLAKGLNMKILSKQHKRDCLESYYNIFDLSGKKNLIGETLFESVEQNLPASECELIWSDVSNGKWLYPKDVMILDLELQARTMQLCIVQVFLALKRNICVTPSHISKLILRYRKKRKLGDFFSYHAFCTDILMPNISDISPDLRDKHILFLLQQLNNFPWIKDMMQKWPCIPVQCSLALRLPKETLDNKNELMSRLYEPEEGYFPAEVLQEQHIMVALRQLGMVHVLSVEQIKERAERVATISPQSKAIERAWLILQYINKKFLKSTSYNVVKSTDKTAELRDALNTVDFIPTAQCPSNIKLTWWNAPIFICPKKIFLPEYNHLVFTQQPVVKLPEDLYLKPQVFLCTSDPPPLNVVIDHLLCLVSCSNKGIDEHTETYLNSAMKDIYKYLKKRLCSYDASMSKKEDIVEAKQRLGENNFFWQERHFLNVSQVFYHWNHDCYPYLCGLSSDNKSYFKLFSLLGMKEEPPFSILINVLCNIAADYPPVNQVPEEIISFIEAIVKKIYHYLVKNEELAPSNIFLPDEKGVMRCVKQLACDKVNECPILPESGEEYYFVHDSIPRQRAVKLGVRPLLDTILRGVEKEDFLKGSDFGQHEDLCHRLESILTKYPTDCSILNEFIQNADDAGASEIVFVLDKRSHPQKNLLSHAEQWENLQCTPALCIFNNKMFQEEDIKGITQLGRGTKSDSAETIGKFGIGFNVAYHITDCPSFVSFNEQGNPDNFCVFDPTCSYVPYASKNNPGKRWDICKRPTLVENFPDQFQPYLMNDLETLSNIAHGCLQSVCEQGYVVFRLPLTRQKQPLHSSTLPNECLMHSLNVPTRQQRHYTSMPYSSNETKKRFLNVPKIFDEKSVHKLLYDMKDLSCDTMLFLQHIRNMSAFEISPDGKHSLLFSTQSSMSHEEAQKCYEFHKMRKNVSLNEKKVLTLSNTTIISHTTPDRNNDLVTSDVKWLVNWRYSTVDMERSLLQKAFQCHLRPLGGVAAPIAVTKRHHFLFCFLPMPLESGHPVHLNGHFLVDDSRKHLETKVHQGLDDWNRSLAVKIIAPCYVNLLMEAQKMTESSETDYQWFYSLFPTVEDGEVGELKLAEAVYSGLLEINPKILLQTKSNPNGPDIRAWFHLKENDMGFFFCSFTSECTQQLLNADDDVKKSLVALGMPITTEAPLTLYESLCSVDSNYRHQARVDPHKVIAQFKLLKQSNLQAVLAKKDILQLLLQFLVYGMIKQDLKKALRGVPLLLACDGQLKKGPTLFNSTYMSLLPNYCSAYFIDKEIESSEVGHVLAREDYKVVVPLEVSFVANNIALQDTNQAIPLDSLSSVEVNLIKHLWPYLINNDISFHELCSYFSRKPIIPTEDRLIFPVYLANTVLCKRHLCGNVHICSALEKLGYSILSFEVLGMHLENWAQVLNVNACLNGGDIIKCFSTIPPPNCHVEMTNEEVRAIIENLRVCHKSKIHDIKLLLQRLKLYETIEGDFISVEREHNVVIAYIPHEMPLTELIILQEKLNCIFLKMKDKYISQFYRYVFPHAIVLNRERDFYIEYVIPNIMEFSDDALEKHLHYIYYHHSRDSLLMCQLKESKFIKIDGHQFKPAEVYDPNCEFSFFFKMFCCDNILPPPWSEKHWQLFFKELGLKQTVSCGEWLVHARKFAKSELSIIHHGQLGCKSMALLKVLILMIEQKIIRNDSCMETFLKEVSEIKFIYNPVLPHLQLLVQTVFKKKTVRKHQMFCFQGSVISLESDLAALCRNILPECCNETLLKYADVRKALYIEYPVQFSTVVENLKSFSEQYSHLQNVSKTKGEEQSKAMDIMSAHYAVLNKTTKCSEIVYLQSLKNIKCIAIGKSSSHSSFHLIEPTQLVMSHDIDLEPFCYLVPDNLRQYSNFWEALAVPKTLTANRCADILHSIYSVLEECKTKLSENDEYKKITLSAYTSLVLIQRADEEDLPNQLFLPSEDDELLPNDELLHNNANWYAQRLPKKHVAFLKLPPADEKGEKDPPASLGVKLLTDVVTEELHPDMYSSDVACTKETLYATGRSGRCEYVNKIQSTLISSHLHDGLLRVYFEEHIERPLLEFLRVVQNLQHIDIKCVMSDAISTQLLMDTMILNDTNHKKYCHVSFSEEIPQIWIAPHGPFDMSKFLESLSRAIKLLLNNQIKNEAHLMAMFDCHPYEIEEALDQRQVGPYSPDHVKETKYSKVGDKLSKDSINLEEYLIILNFDTGEKVKYQDSSGVLILAEVIEVLPSNLLYEKTITIRTTDHAQGSDYECKETEDCISVSPLSLYKNLTPSQRIYLSKKSPYSAMKFISPLCLAEVPDTQDKLFEWLDAIHSSLFFSEQSVEVKLLILQRIQKHLVYVLKGEEKEAGLQHLQCFQLEYLVPVISLTTQYSPSFECNVAPVASPNLPQLLLPQQRQPRFQPRQRRGYQPQQRIRRFQPEVRIEQPSSLPPPVSDRDAQIWFDQAKADYKAAEFLMAQITLTPRVERCYSSESSSQVSSQYPALVCFLCHETIEKCLKGALYTYCGLSPNLVNCSTLVSLLKEFESSEHSPKELLPLIQECVMHMNEHENKSRLPNYQIPPCAPAAVYTPFNANEAFLSTQSLLQHLMGDSKLNLLLGDLGELPKPKFTSSLKAMAGIDTGK